MISIIVPTFKPQSYLWECLYSIKNQTLTKEEWELILILNGPQQPYEEEIRRFLSAEFCGFQTVFLQSEEAGVSNARNLGLDAARGNFISFIDDDDCVAPDFLERLLQHADNQSVTVGKVRTFENDLNELGSDYLTRAFEQNERTPATNLFKLRSFLSSSCCQLIPTQLIDNQRFNTNFRRGEDSLFMFSLASKIRRINLVNVVYFRRLRTGSASRGARAAFAERCRHKIQLIKEYTRLYVRACCPKRLFWLWLSRVAAAILK